MDAVGILQHPLACVFPGHDDQVVAVVSVGNHLLDFFNVCPVGAHRPVGSHPDHGHSVPVAAHGVGFNHGLLRHRNRLSALKPPEPVGVTPAFVLDHVPEQLALHPGQDAGVDARLVLCQGLRQVAGFGFDAQAVVGIVVSPEIAHDHILRGIRRDGEAAHHHGVRALPGHDGLNGLSPAAQIYAGEALGNHVRIGADDGVLDSLLGGQPASHALGEGISPAVHRGAVSPGAASGSLLDFLYFFLRRFQPEQHFLHRSGGGLGALRPVALGNRGLYHAAGGPVGGNPQLARCIPAIQSAFQPLPRNQAFLGQTYRPVPIQGDNAAHLSTAHLQGLAQALPFFVPFCRNRDAHHSVSDLPLHPRPGHGSLAKDCNACHVFTLHSPYSTRFHI